jgi:hypothetical protein
MRGANYYLVRGLVRTAFRLVVFGLLAWMLILMVNGCDPLAAKYRCAPITVIVQPAVTNTLWGIVSQHCTGDLAHATDDLVRDYGSAIHVGDRIVLHTAG